MAFLESADVADSNTAGYPGMYYEADDPGIFDLDRADQSGLIIDGNVYLAMQGSVCVEQSSGYCRFDNRITHFIDASNIYGSDEHQAMGLRSFEMGQLRTRSYDLPVFGAPAFVPSVHLDNMPVTYAEGCNNLYKVASLLQFVPDESMTCVGDSRGHENVFLTAIHILWMREHNRKASELAQLHPNWKDERLYQEARKFTTALYNKVVYEEWLPAILGSQADLIPEYSGYKAWTDPRIDLAFTTAGFRVGHTMVPEFVTPLDECLNSSIDAPPPRNTLAFAGQTGGPIDIFALLSLTRGIDSAFRAMILGKALKVDTRVEDSIRSIPNTSVAFDTLATNINRGRMNGIETYLQLRAIYAPVGSKLIYGKPGCDFFNRFSSDPDPLACFTHITGDANTALAETLKGLYSKISKIDAWPGLMAEPHVEGSSLGVTAATMIARQFIRSRDGDRFFYKNGWFDAQALSEIEATSFTDIIARNSGVEWDLTSSFTAPPDASVYKPESCAL